MKIDPRCSLLILSCDAYSDLWQPFFTLLEREWPDCPYERFLGAGRKECVAPGIVTLKSEGGRDWSQCALDYLRQISTDYVLLMLDDFFLRGKVQTHDVHYCLDFAVKAKARQVRLIPRPGPSEGLPEEKLIGTCAPDVRYRVCTQAAIWKKTALVELLKTGETAWEFEHNATLRAKSQLSGHFAVCRSVLPYQGIWAHHVVEKGHWLPHEKWIFTRRKIGCDFSCRPTLDWRATALCQAARLTLYLLALLPRRQAESGRLFFRYIVSKASDRALGRLAGKNVKAP